MHALDEGQVFRAYELYLSAGLYNAAHELAVLELAPDAIIHRDLELLKELYAYCWCVRSTYNLPD